MSCPICAGKTRAQYRPFCSRRCADLDLGKWLTGRYAVPMDAPDDIPGDTGDDTGDDTGRAHLSSIAPAPKIH